jgi:NAD(P)-dependent dehydrogenase (short-subunit alcohol dehydrogenase family)
MSVFHPDCLSGRLVLITGGCGALGVSIVQTLLAHGASVAVNDIVEEKKIPEPLKHDRVRYYAGDAREPAVVKAMFDRVQSQQGLPDVVCCHAGLVDALPITEWSIERFDEIMQLNVRSTFIVAQEATKRMIPAERKSFPRKLIFTSSWVENVPWPEIGPYTASKAAVRMLMRNFARELCDKHILCNALSPGIVGAGMALKQWNDIPSYRARAEKAIPLGHLQTPQSVADAMLFLCSDASNYMTGSTLLVDGGCSLYPMI